MLQAFHAVTGDVAADVAELAAGRAFNPQRNHRQLPPYSEAEWDRLVQTCRTIVDESYAAHRQALAAAERGQHPRAGGWRAENLRWLLARLGPVTSTDFGVEVGCTQGAVQQRGGFCQASAEMFPTKRHADRLSAAVRRLLRDRAGRHRRFGSRRHRLGR
jgi:hypothetical protein